MNIISSSFFKAALYSLFSLARNINEGPDGPSLFKRHLEQVLNDAEAEVTRLRDSLKDERDTIARLLADPSPVFAIVWSRDCDCCESTYAQRWDSEADYQRWLHDAYSWAEGPISVQTCTKEEYEDFEATTRDRALEAYENGRGNSVLL